MIKRESLRNQVVAEVWQMMLQGELRPGTGLNETSLAASLGISRTPLREALLQLERDGFLSSSPGKGFRVKPLNAEEVREMFPLRSLLESYALKAAGLPDASTLAKLRQCHEELSALPAGTEWVEGDERFHELLIKHCPNQMLLGMIDSLRRHARLYTTIYLRVGEDVGNSVEEHGEIVTHLENGDLESAHRFLVQNLTRTQEPMIAWIAKHPQAVGNP